MEVAVSVVSSLVTAAVLKLLKVVDEERGNLKVDAGSIELDLKLIQATIFRTPLIGRVISTPLQRECIAQLRRLADEIEDCIDGFRVGKTNRRQFGRAIGKLKAKSQDIRDKMESYIRLEISLTAFSSSQEQQLGAPPPVVHEDLQAFLSTYDSNSRPAIINCLLYFCMFPRDRPARRNPLIRRWLSEGLVHRENDAVKNLEALIDRSIIDSIQVSNSGKAKRCQPHVGVMDYISEQSISQNFMMSCDEDTAGRAVEYVRRLSLHPAGGSLNLPENLCRIRTLAVFPAANYVAANFNLARFEVLRVLDLKECSHLGKDHLSAICVLLLLKYLSFGGSVRRVPRKITNLIGLETLDLRRSETVDLHPGVIQLPELKHLLGKFRLSGLDTTKSGMEKLLKFLAEKSNLETLSGFVTGGTRGFPELMKHMRRLRKVKTWCDSTADATNMTHLLEAVKVFVRDGNNDLLPRSLSINFQECSLAFPDTLQAPGSLTSLKLCGKLSGFPDLVTQLNSIDELCLSFTNLTGDKILDGIKSLLTLRYLKLTEDNLGPLEIQPEHSPGLERICLVGIQSLEVKIQDGALPRLVSLHLLCRALHLLPGIPSGIEITHMAGLKHVGIYSEVEHDIRDGWQAAANINMFNLSFVPSP